MRENKIKTLKLHPQDNILIVVDENGLRCGEKIPSHEFCAKSAIPMGHKVADRAIHQGESILKFNHIIGVATQFISAGDYVHTHNVAMPKQQELLADPLASSANASIITDLSSFFMGYKRTGGRAGIRNYILVVATVNCSSTVVKRVCQYFKQIDLSEKNIDGVIPVTHSMGCAQAIDGLNYRTLNNTLAGWTHHPNVVGTLFIGLGCEGTTYQSIKKQAVLLGYQSISPELHFCIQDKGGTQAAINFGIEQIERLIDKLPKFKREKLPAKELALALNCGGSDAFSSLTANPALGVASDLLISEHGSSILSEIPECHGAEELLLERTSNPSIKKKLIDLFNWWRSYAKKHSIDFNDNLSPGNIKGGITTIIEKSLGAISKGGRASINDVIDYAFPIPPTGFALMNTPGFDPVSVTGLVAGGCNIVCFTTGRGSVYGCSIAPTIKIATNSTLFEKMKEDMDFDAGTIISQEKNIETVGRDLYQFILDTASGMKTKSELLHLGWDEFIPWNRGETL